MIKGIDLSYAQNKVEYNKLNIDFSIIRSGYGQNKSQKDNMFEKHYEGMKNNNIKIGVYHYSYMTGVEGAKKEALNCLNIINSKKLDLPIFIDVEEARTKKLGKETITNGIIEFAKIIQNAGYNAGCYANLDWFKNYIDIEKLKENKIQIWLAQWNDKITANFKVDFWQYTSKGNIEGIEGYVDLDYMLSVDNVDKPVEKKKTVEEIAQEVINGKWGNGEERKQRLTNAGYNYYSIQDKVNELLGYQTKYYVIVKKGDTVWNLAQKYKTTVNQIAKWNNLGNPDYIVVGQKIRVK